MKIKAILTIGGCILIATAAIAWLKEMYNLSPLAFAGVGLLILFAGRFVPSSTRSGQLRHELRIRASASNLTPQSSSPPMDAIGIRRALRGKRVVVAEFR